MSDVNSGERSGMPRVSLIWAQSLEGAIGRDGGIPWRLAEDMKRFQLLTSGGLNPTVIMGRKTWLSLPSFARPFKGRRNIVLSSSPDSFDHVGAEVVSSLEEALALCDFEDSVWVVGGVGVYVEAFDFADVIELTTVFVDVPDADTFMPSLPDRFVLSGSSGRLVSDNGVEYEFSTWTRTVFDKADKFMVEL